MRFLVVTKSTHPIPPEVFGGLIDAMTAWTRRYEAKMEQVWAFAGIPGGCGIIIIDSLDELDAIMVEFPFGPFSDIEIYPLVDLGAALQRAKQAAQAMAGGG